MIKRRFYRVEHGDKDEASSDSSSSSSSSSSEQSEHEPQVSDSDDEVQNHANCGISNDTAADDDNDDEDDDGGEDEENDDSSIFKLQYPSSGYESEDSSGNEVDADTTGLITRDDDSESESDKDLFDDGPVPVEENIGTVKTSLGDQPATENVQSCVLKCKEVFKCRLCPKIVCLNEESLTTHLKSKRHARSEKLLNNGKLKRILNSDGEEEVLADDEDVETHAERHARILAMAQAQDVPKKTKGRQRQRQRLKRKKQDTDDTPKPVPQRENRPKRRSDAPKPGPQKENRSKRRKKNMD